jgi:hypothetical protein
MSKFVVYKKITNDNGRISRKSLMGLQSNNKDYIYKFITFNKFEKKETKIPEDYKKSSMNKDHITEYYYDNKLENNNNEYLKIKEKLKSYKKIFNDFLIYYNKEEAYIYEKNNNRYENNKVDDYVKLVKKFKFVEMFKSNKSLLFRINKDSYIFVGSEIYKFKMSNDNVKKFLSPIGNSNVSYPFIIGEFNVYFMLDKKYVDKMSFNINVEKEKDLYNYYYSDKNLIKKTFKNLTIIK